MDFLLWIMISFGEDGRILRKLIYLHYTVHASKWKHAPKKGVLFLIF